MDFGMSPRCSLASYPEIIRDVAFLDKNIFAASYEIGRQSNVGSTSVIT